MVDTVQVVRGQEFRKEFVWVDDQNAPQDATSATVTALLRHPWTHVDYGIALTAGWTDPANGQGELHVDELETAKIELGALSELVITVVSPGVVTDVFVGGVIEGI